MSQFWKLQNLVTSMSVCPARKKCHTALETTKPRHFNLSMCHRIKSSQTVLETTKPCHFNQDVQKNNVIHLWKPQNLPLLYRYMQQNNIPDLETRGPINSTFIYVQQKNVTQVWKQQTHIYHFRIGVCSKQIWNSAWLVVTDSDINSQHKCTA